MRTTRSTGFIAVTLTIALLAFEAVAVLGLARVASSWTPPRLAALARAEATTWSALARSTQRAVVTWTLPAALGAVRTTTEVMRAAYQLLPVPERERSESRAAVVVRLAVAQPAVAEPRVVPRPAITAAPVRQHAVVRVEAVRHACTRVVSKAVTRTRTTRSRSTSS